MLLFDRHARSLLVPPEILEPRGRQFRVADCVLDVAMPEVGL